jgi:hypothetical protein
MVNHPDLLISNYGNIKRESTGHIFPKYINHEGYYYCSLCDQGKKFVAKCHREVAKAFIPNPLGKEQVNHIDGNKLNNSVSNLEWCTAKENINHAITFLKVKPGESCKKKVICVDNGKVFSSTNDAGEEVNGNSAGICRCCKHQQETYMGFHWEYV